MVNSVFNNDPREDILNMTVRVKSNPSPVGVNPCTQALDEMFRKDTDLVNHRLSPLPSSWPLFRV